MTLVHTGFVADVLRAKFPFHGQQLIGTVSDQVLQREEAERSSLADAGGAPDAAADHSPTVPAEAHFSDRPALNGAFLPPPPMRGGAR